jgi:hypothetical protein
MIRTLLSTGPRAIGFRDDAPEPLGPAEVRIETL